MRQRWILSAVALLAAVAVTSVVMMFGARQATPGSQEPPANTVTVERGTLSATVFQYGTLTYRARLDGSPYAVVNQARGTYTQLPDDGDSVACGEVLYRVDDRPVLLLCGAVPAYRDLQDGDVGSDVRQLNQNLHALGHDVAAGVAIDSNDNTFTSKTRQALEALQHDAGADVSGAVDLGAALFLPESLRIANITAELGGSAEPGATVLTATSARLEVQMDLEPSQQRAVKAGDPVQISLPGNKAVTGTVDRLGRVAQIPATRDGTPGAATIPAFISLNDPEVAGGLDRAPVQVEITTERVEDVLSVPVTALVGKSGGGIAVEVVRADESRELVAVTLGLFDNAAGRVQVTGDLHEGDQVVVPSS